jgi:hypothetical protein
MGSARVTALACHCIDVFVNIFLMETPDHMYVCVHVMLLQCVVRGRFLPGHASGVEPFTGGSGAALDW